MISILFIDLGEFVYHDEEVSAWPKHFYARPLFFGFKLFQK